MEYCNYCNVQRHVTYIYFTYTLELRKKIMIFFAKIIEERSTLSGGLRLTERMKGSSRRKTALELALKVGGYDEELDESKGRESTKRCELV